MVSVFEVRKDKWLSKDNQVTISGCPYLEQGKWGRVSQLGHENGKSDHHISIFGCPATSRAHGQPKFLTLVGILKIHWYLFKNFRIGPIKFS